MLGATQYAPPRPRRGMPRPRSSVLDLMSRIATDRSDEAFRSLFEEFGPRLRRYMLQQGVDADLADELAQETLVTVWRKAELYSAEKGSPSTWIFTIARNLRIDRIRRQRVWQELTDEHVATIASQDPPPDSAVEQIQRQIRVQAALRDLPPEQIQVVTFVFIEGLPHSEIAERLSLPLGTVKSRIRLAYAKLRGALEELR
jgi:RNA polymerase sigma-70 factor (ECF subfamily)